MRVTSKGQVTIPKEIRHRHGSRAGSRIGFVEKGEGVIVRRDGRRMSTADDDFAACIDRDRRRRHVHGRVHARDAGRMTDR